MSDFTPEQIEALKEFADNLVVEKQDIDKRNKAVNAHTSKLEKAHAEVLKAAEKLGVEPSSFQLAPNVVESGAEHQNFKELEKVTKDIAEKHGLEHFEVRRVT